MDLIDYKIVIESKSEELEVKVMQLVHEGYKLQGGVIMSFSEHYFYLAQAMVKVK